jgi:hypothetical protein
MLFQQNSPTGEKCAAVLITDGAPNGCDESQATLTGIVSDAWNQASVMTFAIGMDGAVFSLLDAIAIAGHTDCTPNTVGHEACNVTSGGTSFNDALDLIRDTVTTYETHTEVRTTALPCEFNIPVPSNGDKLDPAKVNMKFVNGAQSDTILQVPSANDCGAFGDVGWYYDNPAVPTKIQTCPGTCSLIKASSGDGGTSADASVPHVDILLGCATEIAIPH